MNHHNDNVDASLSQSIQPMSGRRFEWDAMTSRVLMNNKCCDVETISVVVNDAFPLNM